MGYEIQLLIGKSCLRHDELKLDKKHPFKDGSGYPYLKAKNGDYVKTGRIESWFQIMAEVDLCKLGYQDDALNRLINETHRLGNENKGRECWYVYGITDGNKTEREDRYGDALRPAPIKEVLKAMRESMDKTHPYRRLVWAEALLSKMAKDPEGLEVIFWGH